MEPQDLKALTDQQLLEEHKKLKKSNITNAFLIGAFVGIAVYSAVKNGVGFFTFFPLIFAYLLFNSSKKARAIKEEMKARNLQ